MSAVQPDLFGDYDRGVERRRRYMAPHTCPACGQTEPNGFLLETNHGVDPETGTIGGAPIADHPILKGHCLNNYQKAQT